MRDNSESFDYSRKDLRKVTKFTEGDYRGINPREFFRSLKRSLEEIQKDGDFKYTTHGDQSTSFSITSEEVGSKTGRVEGRLTANSDYEGIGSGSLEYKPYGPHAAWSIVVGLGLSWLIVPLLLVPLGIYLYLKEDECDLPLLRQDVIRVLMSGEVSERTIEEGAEEKTDIFANLNVIYAGDTFIKVDTGEFDEYRLAHRKRIVQFMKKTFNEVIEDEDLKKDIDSGIIGSFIGHLKAAANNDVQGDVREIEEMQNVLNEKFEYRLEFSEILLKYLSSKDESDLKHYQDSIMMELEELSEDMDVYVEREGMENQ
ncbi:hypothetical protein [Haloarcula sediminis]|uniref:hypothetical protein n=1 Tax=Haloarcula sediminis TaxID=3111777 RepID=UPI002D79EEEB|nr:hypothetical protein [Haloarcula sp. CK38]